MMRRSVLVVCLLLLFVGCQPSEEIRISAVLPLTGAWEIYGQPVRKGIELAVEKVEASGGPSLTLVVVDTESDVERAAELLEEEFDGGAFAAIGGVTSGEALAMVSIADRYDQVLLSPSASNPQLTGISRNFYRVFPSDAREGTTMGNFAASKLQLESVVIVAKEETYAYGVQEVFAAEFERNGGNVLEVIEYPAGGADFSGLLERVAGLEPQAVYLAAYADDISIMIRELRRLGFDGRILTTSAFSSVQVIEELGDAAEGVLLTQAVFEAGSEDPAIQEFVSAYRDEHGFPPDLYAAHGYDAVMVIVEALKGGKPLASDFWKRVRALRDFAGVTGTIQFDERGDVQKFPKVYGVRNGDLIDYGRYIDDERERILEQIRELEEERRRRALQGG